MWSLRTYSQIGSRGLAWKSSTPSRTADGASVSSQARSSAPSTVRVQRAATPASPAKSARSIDPEDAEIVVPAERQRGALAHEPAALVGLRPVADQVAEAPELVGLLALDLGEDRLEGVEVGVDVGDDCDAHGLVAEGFSSPGRRSREATGSP